MTAGPVRSGLAALLAIVAALAVGAYWLGSRLETEGTSVADRPEYRLVVVGTLASVLATQAVVILENVA